MPQLIDRKYKIFFYLILFIILSTQINRNSNFVEKIEIFKNKIQIIGLSDKNNQKVYDNLKFLSSKNIFFIKKNDFIDILKKNNLIEDFYIQKIYPNLIKIVIKQADLLAITNHNGVNFFIGSNSKLIPINQIENLDNNLPFVYGKNNYLNFIEFKKIIDKSSFKFNEIESFYYFPSSRWDIKTKDGFLIKLPEKEILQSLKYANLIKTSNKLNNKKIIDLRVSNNIILSNE